jgi:hypothetical protein
MTVHLRPEIIGGMESELLTTPTADRQPCVLASRENDGIEVSLLWWPGDDHAVVAVVDSKTKQVFQLGTAGVSAMDVFNHPFAYEAAAWPSSLAA